MIIDRKAATDAIHNLIPLHKFLEDDGLELFKNRTGWKASCPFHSEQDPSFTVSVYEGVERYYCFGCHAKGDIIRYVQEQQLINQDEAIIFLAERYEFDLEKFTRTPTSEEAEKSRLYDVMMRVANYLHEKLVGERGAPYEYVKGRGVTDEIIEEFKLGYSINSSDIMSFIFQEKLMPANGLEFDKEYLWSNVITMPTITTSNQIIEFQNKMLSEGTIRFASTSISHPLYDANQMLYGLRQTRKSTDRHIYGLIGVEGRFDCIVQHSGGNRNVTALSSSKFDQRHIDLLRRNRIKKYTVIFDGDDPGIESAAALASDQYLKFGDLDVKVNYIPEYNSDPAIYSPEKFRELVINAKALPIHYIDVLASKYPLFDINNSLSFVKDVGRCVMTMPMFEATIVARYVAEKLNTNEADILDYFFIHYGDNLHSNIGAENSLIKQLIEEADGVLYSEINRRIARDDFALEKNKYLYNLIEIRLADSKLISYEWLIRQARADKYEELVDHIEHNIKTAQIIDITFCVDDLVDKAQRRTMVKLSNNIKAKVNDLNMPVAAILEETSGSIVSIVHSESGAPTRGSIYDRVLRIYEERKNAETAIFGQPMGERFPTANMLLGGLEIGHAWLLSASTGVGKTVTALNWTCDWTITVPEGYEAAKVLYIPLEMDPAVLTMRLWAIHSGIGFTKIHRGMPLTKDEQYELEYTKEICGMVGPIIAKPRENTLSAIIHEINYWKLKEGINIVVVDYLQRVLPCPMTGDRPDWDRYDYSAMRICDMAQVRGDISVVVLSQQSDEAKKAGIDAEGGTSRAKSIPNHFDAHIIEIRKTIKDIERHGAQNGNRYLKFDKTRFSQEQMIIHAHLFNHIVIEDNTELSKYGNLRMGEAGALRALGMDREIIVSKGELGGVI
jgi:DNA primase